MTDSRTPIPTGLLGVPLTRALLADGHEVIALIHARRSTAAGVASVTADALDRESLLRAVDGIEADAVIHELTALAKPPMRHSGMAMTNRLRTEGTANLVAAADVIGAKRFVRQSIILGYGYRDHGDKLITEDDPFGLPQHDKTDPHVAAMLSTEQQAFTAPEGIALRYGMLYGGDLATLQPLIARCRLPVVRGGVLGWVHHEDAAAATVAALDHGRAGQAYNIVDDRPASMAELYTAEAAAPAPRRRASSRPGCCASLPRSSRRSQWTRRCAYRTRRRRSNSAGRLDTRPTATAWLRSAPPGESS
jgi:nucleoside-diphosphate-sugar epimerase